MGIDFITVLATKPSFRPSRSCLAGHQSGGIFNRIRTRTEMTFVLAVAPRTNTNPPLSDQLQSHHLHNGFFNQHDNLF
ncbi:hypothetical protein GQ55_3G175600 [Panicum hallii var. hallii]|uniref:Uncharacterized protein n=1 Tax=Panicum hallii var. hallii TaxID=1504633 RepID=A0A2T7EAI3_9POAL|nr:hypothetical protein GQ55_3G175600 [Panicum hallii var. hallii]